MDVSFYFIRHGKTLFNQRHLVQGWCDSPLVDEGVAVARTMGAKLAGIDFAHAIASDKGRTCQTLAELLDARAAARGEAACAGALLQGAKRSMPASDNVSPSTDGAAAYLAALDDALVSGSPNRACDLPLSCDWRLREWCYGDLEMQSGEMLHQRLIEGFGAQLSFEEENERLPETADNLARLDKSGRAERFADIEERVLSFLQEVGDATLEAGGGNVLAVTHAFTIRTLMWLLDRARINQPRIILNGSLTRIDYDGERFTMREIGVLEPQA